jgi:hypothetical protein
VKPGDVTKLSWSDGFGLGRLLTVRRVTPGVGWKRLPKPIHDKGKVYRFVVVYGEAKDNGKLRPIRLLAFASTEAEARGECERLLQTGREREAKEMKLCEAKPVTAKQGLREQDLHGAQWLVLEKTYPRTVKLLRRAAKAATDQERDRLRTEATVAYKAETFRNTGILPDGQAAPDEKRLIASVLRTGARWHDPVNKALAVHFYRDGWCKLKPKQLADEIFKITGRRLSPAAAKKRRLRLRLVSDNDEGRPVF